MKNSIARRDFIRRVAGQTATVMLGAGGSWAVAAGSTEMEEWAFPLLGDLHIDRPEHHDMEWLAKEHPGDVSQVEHYCRNTREITPALLTAAQQVAAASKARIPFTLQVGDLVEGLCGSQPLAEKQASDALEMVRSAGLSAPFLFTKGNHDVTGPGALETYNKLFVPFMAQQAAQEIRKPAFTREQGGVLFVFYDAYDRGSLDWFTEIMAERKPRRLLFVIHPPIVPYNARSTWHIYSSPKQQPERERLLNLLGRHRAIVLCGHLHKYSLLVRRTGSGRFVQLAISSVADTRDAEPRDLIEDKKEYGPDLMKLEPKHSPGTEAQRRQILAAERPFIERFEYANTWGHGLVSVRGDEVHASIYRGLDQTPWKNLRLSDELQQS